MFLGFWGWRMGLKRVTEEIIVATSQFIRTDLTKRLFSSLRDDGIPFTSMVFFDGTPEKEMKNILNDIDIALYFKTSIHSIPEIVNCLFNFAKCSDAKLVIFCDNDI